MPVLNKIDLPAAEPERIKQQIEDVIGLDASDAVMISAKTGLGVEEVLEAIVHRLPPPKGDAERAAEGAPRRQLVRLLSRRRRAGPHRRRRAEEGPGDPHDAHRTPATTVDRVGFFTPKMIDIGELGPGEIGFLTGSIKEVADTRVGDTITDDRRRAAEPLPGFRPAQPVVFCGLFPVDAADFENLRAAIGKLRLNDASFSYEMETSAALGFGFRCGFLGLLHLEIIQERLTREFDLDLIATAPSVIYQIRLTDGTRDRAAQPGRHAGPGAGSRRSASRGSAPPSSRPTSYLGAILKLCQDRRGIQVDLSYVGSRAMVQYDLPLNEVVFDFYDRLKSVSKGYASFDYHITGYREGDLVKMSILVNAEPVDALSMLVHRSQAEKRGRAHGGEAQGADPAAPLQDPDPGGDRRQGHRPRDDLGAPQGRDGQVLRRRHHAQTQAPRQAEGGQEEDAPVRQGRHPAGGVHPGAEDGGVRGVVRDETVSIARGRRSLFRVRSSMSNNARTGATSMPNRMPSRRKTAILARPDRDCLDEDAVDVDLEDYH